MKALTLIVILANLCVPASAAMFGWTDTPAGSAFASACAGNQISGSGHPGRSVTSLSYAGGPCHEAVNAGLGVASVDTGLVTGSNFGNAYSGSAKATADVGLIKLEGTNSGSSATGFSGGMANAGWNDNITLTGGVGNAFWIVPILVHGQLTANGQGGLARMQVGVYKNNNFLQPYGSPFNQAYTLFAALTTERNGDILYSWEYQMAAFGADDYGTGDLLTTLNINQTVYFVIPFTYGTSFKLGIWADAHASEIASGGSVVPNTSSFQLGNTISWNGKGYVMTDTTNPATQTTSFGINSTSSFDYTNAYTPEPSTTALVLAGGLLLLIKRAVRR